VVTVGYDKVQW